MEKETSYIQILADISVGGWENHLHRILNTGVEYPLKNITPDGDIFCNIPEYMYARGASTESLEEAVMSYIMLSKKSAPKGDILRNLPEYMSSSGVSTEALEEALMSYMVVSKNSTPVKDIFIRLFVSLMYYKKLSDKTIVFLIECIKNKGMQHMLIPHNQSSSMSTLAARILSHQILSGDQRNDIESYLKSHLRHKLSDPMWWIEYVKFVVAQHPTDYARQLISLEKVIDEFVERGDITRSEMNKISDLVGHMHWIASNKEDAPAYVEEFYIWRKAISKTHKNNELFSSIIAAIDNQFEIDRKNSTAK